MALRNIRRQETRCCEKAVPVTRFNEQLHRLLDDMVETMIKAQGAGLAAPQIGISKKIIVLRDEDKILEIINPEITESEGESIDIEGCLSFPDSMARFLALPGWHLAGRTGEAVKKGFPVKVF